MPSNTRVDRVLLPVADVGAALGIGKTLAWRLVRDGELPSVRIGKRRLVPAAALQEYIVKLVREAAR